MLSSLDTGFVKFFKSLFFGCCLSKTPSAGDVGTLSASELLASSDLSV